MSTPLRKREPMRIQTSESGRRYVSIRELIRGEMERLEQGPPAPPVNGSADSKANVVPKEDKKQKRAAG